MIRTTLLLVATLLVSARAGQECPRCADVSIRGGYSPTYINTCSTVIGNPRDSRWRECYGGQVCKVIEASGTSYSLYSSSLTSEVRIIDCYDPSDSCYSIMHKSPTARRSGVVYSSCTAEDYHPPVQCPRCYIGTLTSGTQEITFTDTCSSQMSSTSAWETCESGVTCRFNKHSGSYRSDEVYATVKLVAVGCGLDRDDCRNLNSEFESMTTGLDLYSYCPSGEFPDDYN